MPILNEALKTWNYLLKFSMTSTEIMLNSTQAITHRVKLLSDHSTSHEEAEEEILCMHQEKLDVAVDSLSIMMSGYVHLGNEWFQANTRSYSPLTTETLSCPQMSYWDMLNNHSLDTMKMTNATLAVLDDSMKPVHSRTAHNVKRLAS